VAVKVEVTFEMIDKLSKELEKMRSKIDGANQNFKKLNTTIESQGHVMSFLKTKILPLVTAYAGFNIVRNIVSSFVDFNEAIIEITTIMPDATKVNNAFRKTLIDISAQFGTTSAAQAKAYYQIISAGVTDAAKAQELLIAANKLAVGGLADIQGTINILTDALNVYGQQNLSAADAADSLFTAVRLGKTRIEELAGSFGRLLPTAKQLGISFAEVAATVATLTTRGLTTAERVTQLDAVFTALLKKQGEAARIGGRVAEAFTLQALRTKGLVKFLKDLFDATGRSEEVLTKLLGRVEGSKAILTLASDNFQKLGDNLNQFKDRAGAADEAFKKASKSIRKQLEILGSKIVAFFEKQLIKIEGPLSQIIGLLNDGFDPALEESSEEVRKLKEEIDKLEDIRAVEEFLEKMSFGLAVTDIDKTTEKLEDLRKKLKEIQALGPVKPITPPKEEAPPEAVPTITPEELKKVQGKIQLAVGIIISGDAAKGMIALFNKSGNIWLQAVAGAVQILGQEEDKFRKMIESIFKTGRELPKIMARNIGVLIEEAFRSIPESLIDARNMIPNIIKGFIDGLRTAFTDKTLINDIMQAMADILVGLETNPEFISAMTEAGVQIANGLAEALTAHFLDPEFVNNLAKGQINAFKHAITDFIKNGAPRIADSIVDSIRKQSVGLFDKYVSIVNEFGSAVGFFSDIIGELKKFLSSIGGGVSKAGGGIVDFIKSISPFQEGGDIPRNMLAFVHKNENVIDKTTNTRLGNMLDAFERGDLAGPQTIIVKSVIGESEFAEAIHSLSRRGFRLNAA